MGTALTPTAAGVRIRVKVVPGARRTAVSGWLGDRLKLSVAAPPQRGRANQALCAFLARLLGVPARLVTVVHGMTEPCKTVEVAGVSAAVASRRLDDALGHGGASPRPRR